MRTTDKTSEWKKISELLRNLSSKDMIGLVHELYQNSDANRSFIVARFVKDGDSLKKYKQRVHREIYPDFNSGKTDISISAAKKVISDFEKATHNPKQTLDLMIYFVEVGTQMMKDFGMDYEAFYDSMESMFTRVFKRLKGQDRELLPTFWDRLQKLKRAARDTGYGYGDSLESMMEDLGGPQSHSAGKEQYETL
ncbi:MAG: DUF6155 family protein [Pseudomonadota bacterium]